MRPKTARMAVEMTEAELRDCFRAASRKNLEDNTSSTSLYYGLTPWGSTPCKYDPLPGDHIRVRCWFGPIPYHHHGIVVWDHENNRASAIHYDSGLEGVGGFGTKQRMRIASVRMTDLGRFAGDAGLNAIKLVERPVNRSAVVNRARSALGAALWAEGTYDVLSNNCEHFASWCIRGWGYSHQVVNYSILATGIGACASATTYCLCGSAIARIGEALGLGYLLPGIGWVILGAGVVYAACTLAKELGFGCNGKYTEIDGAKLRNLALAYGVQLG
jgi:hypothetical protein